jgi:hypothetical protein
MKNVLKVFGIIALVAIIGFSFAACGGGDGGGDGGIIYIPPEIPPEMKPVADRWGKWVEPSSTATLDYSVADDGVCRIMVSGTPEPNNGTDGWYRWKANAGYSYTAKAGTFYNYTFEAWTETGTRNLTVQYYADNDELVYLSSSIGLITDTPTTYTVTGQVLPKGGKREVEFQCADQTGTFYVKILEIKEYSLDGIWNKYPWALIISGSTYTSIYNVGNYGKGIISYIDGSTIKLVSTHAWDDSSSSWIPYREETIAWYTLNGTTLSISYISNPRYSALVGSWTKTKQ